MEETEVSRSSSGFMKSMLDISNKSIINTVPHNPAALQTSAAVQGISYKHKQQPQTQEKCNLSLRTKDTKDSISTDSCFSHFSKGGRRYTRCEVCFRHPDIVKQHLPTKRVPLIVQKCGLIFSKASLIKHRKVVYHLEALRMHHRKSCVFSKSNTDNVEKHVLAKDKEVVAKVGRVMIQVYHDAKELTFDLGSFPGKMFTLNLASAFNLTRTQIPLKSSDSSALQQDDALDHQKYLQCIVDSDEKHSISDAISEALALSLHCSGSVDKMGTDKVYVRAKVMTKTAEVRVYFLGVVEPLERNAISLLIALDSACLKTVGSDIFRTVLKKTSSMVMDGICLDPKEIETMWVLMRQMQEARAGSFKDLPPLLTNWCNVHRSDLAWETVGHSVEVIYNIFQNLTNVCRFFHKSSIRLREMREIAEKANLAFESLPEIFEVKWSDFTSDFLSKILVAWLPLVLYAKKSTEKEASGILGFLTEISNINVLTFLADVLSVFSIYQKNLASDGVTLVDILHETQETRKRLFSLIETPPLDGWVAAMEEELVDDEDTGLTLQGIQLYKPFFFTDFVNNKLAIRTKVVKHLVDFLMQNWSDDEEIDAVKRFVTLSPNTNLKAVHQILCPDLELKQLEQEYLHLMKRNNLNKIRQKTLHDLIQELASSNTYPILMTAYSRILVAKPDLVDVKSMVSLINKWKPSEKSNLSTEVESLCLYVHYNLPAMHEWNPEQAIALWYKRNESS